MDRRIVVCFALALASVACSSDDNARVLEPAPAAVAGTWSVLVTSQGSLLTDCEGATVVPPPGSYTGLLRKADIVGTVVIDQMGDRFSIRPVVDSQPSGLTATITGDGSVSGSTIVATVELALADPSRPEPDLQFEMLQGVVTGPMSLRLTADRWTVETGGCAITPPVEYEILIQ